MKTLGNGCFDSYFELSTFQSLAASLVIFASKNRFFNFWSSPEGNRIIGFDKDLSKSLLNIKKASQIKKNSFKLALALSWQSS